MVRRVIDIFYKEIKGLHQAAYILALFALGSQLLALLRDRLLAHEFGAGEMLDIYYASFRIPDLLFVLFASTLSVYVLIPFVSRSQEAGGDKAGSHLLSSVFTLFMLVYAAVSLLLFFLFPIISPKIFPGIVNQELLVNITRALLLQPVFLGISSLFGVITQIGHRFVLYAISPLIYNLGIIAGILLFYPSLGLLGLALGVVIGALGHMAIQIPFISGSNLRFGLTAKINWSEIKEILSLSVPRALTLSLNQIVLLILAGLSSVMASGSVSVFQFAYNIQSVPLAIIGVSYSVAAFPALAEMHARQEFDKFLIHVTTALRHVIFWSVPAIALIIVLRAQLVRVVLGTGAFDWADTRLTAAVLALLSLSLLAQAINLLIVRAFYAGGNTRIPFYITVFGSLLAILTAYGFFLIYAAHDEVHSTISAFMRLENVVGSEVLSVAFGYAIATIIQSVMFIVALKIYFKLPLNFFGHSFSHSLSAAAVGGFLSYMSLNFLVDGINPETFIGIFIQGFLSGIVGIVGIALTYAGLRSPELREVYNSFHKKILKTDVVAPQEEIGS